MTSANFTKPTTVQDFGILLTAEDIKDGKLTEEVKAQLGSMFVSTVYRFLPQIAPGKSASIRIRMETEK